MTLVEYLRPLISELNNSLFIGLVFGIVLANLQKVINIDEFFKMVDEPNDIFKIFKKFLIFKPINWAVKLIGLFIYINLLIILALFGVLLFLSALYLIS